MKITDPIYGDFEISEPVLLELLKTPSVTRLNKINQFAVPQKYHEITCYTRYEHSVGVMLLLRKLGADLEEQVTGLLHDVSHTAFSHLVDLVLDSESIEEDYQDKRHYGVIAGSEIPAILLKHGLNVGRVADHKSDSLLEKDIPELCADRVDYGLREIYHVVDKSIPAKLYRDLTAVNNRIVFANKESAKQFAMLFLGRQKEHWGNPRHMLRWHIFSEMMKKAIKKGIISIRDFDSTDDEVMSKLLAAKDPEIDAVLASLQEPLNFKLVSENPALVLKKKFRYVDPLYLDGGQLLRLSETDEEFKNAVEQEQIANKQGVSLTFNING